MNGVISWFGTWLVMIVFLVLMSKTGWGRTFVYYVLWLAVALLLVTHADELSAFIDLKALELNG